MVSVFLGAAALSAALAGGYGLYKYWSRTDNVELSSTSTEQQAIRVSPSPPPVASKPFLSGQAPKSPPPVASKPSLSGQAPKSPPPVASKPPRNRVVTPSSIKLTTFGLSPTPQRDEPATFDEPPHRATLSSPLRNRGPSNRRPPTRVRH